ncbi:MAG: 5-oxoprolinase subunit PxpB [Opitutaceae bacterium]|nr:5-oxoprolinase subunit PxpB [Opitutaceae bacterium]MBP9914463.1 5-oxoprolinase subunit PxpB [Opitutaceae bacterium]
MRFTPLGDTAVTVELGPEINAATLAPVRALALSLEAEPLPGVVDVVAAYNTVTVFYELPQARGYDALCVAIEKRMQGLKVVSIKSGRVITVPVCYGGEFGPDLEMVAAHAGMKEKAMIALHSAARYLVQAVGFTPGFAYLGGLPTKLHTPRLATPRTLVPAGSVGIGGGQTGVYPLASPGGWNLIGRTPLKLFQPAAREPALLRVGDRVKFKAITAEEFAAWK